jgi:type IV pilus assembly protein PilA
MLKQVQKGFTLIELMIVVAIIGILAAIAIPAYQDYTIRAQVTEGLNLASAVKAGVAEAYANNGSWPADIGIAGGDTANLPSGKYVDNITVEGGNIVITYGKQANTANLDTKVLVLKPGLSVNNDVIWVCGNADAPAAITMAPDPVTASNLENKYLPSNCRAP